MPYKNPEKERAYERAYKRVTRAAVPQTPGTTPVPLPFRLKTAADVLALLEEQIGAVRDDPDVAA